MLTLPIAEVLPATPRARILHISLEGQPFTYLPGQAVLIGGQGTGKRRPYSIASAPEDAERAGLLELLIGVDSAGSPGPHLRLEPGQLVEVDGPLGQFTFPATPPEKRFVFIAGGTGIAPLRAMLRHALHVDHESVGLLYSARTAGEFAYENELRRLAQMGALEFSQTVTRERTSESWSGSQGRIDRAALEQLIHDPETLCFICGPPALVADMPKLLGELGIAPEKIRREEWGS